MMPEKMRKALKKDKPTAPKEAQPTAGADSTPDLAGIEDIQSVPPGVLAAKILMLQRLAGNSAVVGLLAQRTKPVETPPENATASVQRIMSSQGGVIQRLTEAEKKDREKKAVQAQKDAEKARDEAKTAADEAEKKTDCKEAQEFFTKADEAWKRAEQFSKEARMANSDIRTFVSDGANKKAKEAEGEAKGHRDRAEKAVNKLAGARVTYLLKQANDHFTKVLAGIEKLMDEALRLAKRCAQSSTFAKADYLAKKADEINQEAGKADESIKNGYKLLDEAGPVARIASPAITLPPASRQAADAQAASINQAVKTISSAAQNAAEAAQAKKEAQDAAKAAREAQKDATKAAQESTAAAEAAKKALDLSQKADELDKKLKAAEAKAALQADAARKTFEGLQLNAQELEANLKKPVNPEQVTKEQANAQQALDEARQKAEAARIVAEKESTQLGQASKAREQAESDATQKGLERDKAQTLAAEKASELHAANTERDEANKLKTEKADAEKTTSGEVTSWVGQAQADNAGWRKIRSMVGEVDAQQLLILVPNIAELEALLTAVRLYYPKADAKAAIASLIGKKGAATLTELTAYVTAVGANGTIDEIVTLIDKANGLSAVPTLTELTTFVTTAKTRYTSTKDLALKLAGFVVDVAKKGSLDEINKLLDAVDKNGTLEETRNLVNQAVKNGAANISEVTALVEAAPKAAKVADNLTKLLFQLQKKGSLAETTELVKASVANYSGDIPTLTTVVSNAGAAKNVCVQLKQILDAVASKGTLLDIASMVSQAVTTLGEDYISDLVVLITRDPAKNTPAQVRAFLAVLGSNNRDRYTLIQPLIPNFKHKVHPGGALKTYYSNGHTFRCDRWDYFSKRHTYAYFNFEGIDYDNTMWDPATTPEAELDTAMGALSQAQANALAGPGYHAEPVGNTEVGVNNSGYITHVMPRKGVNFSGAEMLAIKDLR